MFDHLPYDLLSLGLNGLLSFASTDCASLDMTLAAMTINIVTEASTELLVKTAVVRWNGVNLK